MNVKPRGNRKPKVPVVSKVVPEDTPILPDSDVSVVPKAPMKRAQLSASQLKQVAEWYDTTGSYARTAKLAEEAGIHISATSISTKLRERRLYLDSQ